MISLIFPVKKRIREYLSSRVLVLSMIGVVIAAGIGSLVGLSVFRIPDESRLNSIGAYLEQINMELVVHILLLAFTTVLVTLISTQTKLRLELALICVFGAFLVQLPDNDYLPTLFALLCVWAFGYENLRYSVLRFANLMVITGGYQWLATLYKKGFILHQNSFTIGEVLLYSVDNIALLIAIHYDQKGIDFNEQTFKQVLVYPFVRQPRVLPRYSEPAHEDFSTVVLSYADRVILTVVALFQLGVVAMAVTLNSRFIVWLIVYIFGFFPQKLVTGFSYHANTILGCTFQSLIAFYIACAIVPQVGVSVLLPVASGALLVVVIQFITKR